MDDYGALRSFADSWALLLMVILFVGIVVWVFRPGARKSQDEAARMIFRNEDKPKDEDESDGR